MSDKKISQLTDLPAASVSPSNDVLAIVDTSATETKKITAKAVVDGALNAGTANGLVYLNGSKEATTGSIISYDGTTFGVDDAVVINESGGDNDTRIEGDTDANLFFVDASTDRIGVGTNAPGSKLDVVSTAASTQQIRINNASASSGAYAQFRADGDAVSAYFGVSGTGNAVTGGAFDGDFAYLFTDSNAAGLNVGTSPAVPLKFYTNNTLRATLDSSGNLGLGVTPSAAGAGVTLFQGGSFFVVAGGGNTILSNNAVNNSGYKYITTDTAGRYQISGNEHQWYTAPSGNAGDPITFSQAMTLDASGNLLVGKTVTTNTTPGIAISSGLYAATASSTSTNLATNNGAALNLINSSATDGNFSNIGAYNSNGLVVSQIDFINVSHASRTGDIAFLTHNGSSLLERARIDSSGNVGINESSPQFKLDVENVGGDAIRINGGNDFSGLRLTSTGGEWAVRTATTDALIFYDVTSAAERARITSGGNLLVGTTNSNPAGANVTGHSLLAGGLAEHSNDANVVVIVNRKTDDGELIRFLQAGASEGSISVSGGTVSYNAFAGSHWSQLQDGSKPDILRGTVMESINELCVWPGEENERLPKSKISDTAGSKKVYGVFMAWDNDWSETNDMYVTAVGAFICRVNGSVTVQEGDLLESNGDGTARVQADDIIRSSTIGKVTSTVKTHEYDDGSYCVPTVLYCG